MTELSQLILSEYQMRKTKAQKLAFIDLMKEHFPTLWVQEGGFLHNRNLILGEVSTAKVLLGAHYDTCAKLPFPNFLTPKNILFYILYNIVVAAPFCALMPLMMRLLTWWNPDMFWLNYWISFLGMMGLLLYVFVLGKPNRHTANDNTSGIITLIELYHSLSEEQRSQVAFIFFDNEENGLLGSGFFRKKYKREIKDKLLINFDCVSDGDHMLVVQNKLMRKQYGELLQQAMVDTEEIQVHLEKSSNTVYPSDQSGFPINMAISSMNHKKGIGLYMNRIHTDKDTVFEEKNIRYLCDHIGAFLGKILSQEIASGDPE